MRIYIWEDGSFICMQSRGSGADDYRVRDAEAADEKALRRMAIELQKHVEGCNPDIWRASQEGLDYLGNTLIEALSNRDCRVLVAADPAGKVMGFAKASVRVLDRYGGITVGRIDRAYVLDGHRGGGIGSALVECLCDFFGSRGADDISVRYVVGNPEAEDFWDGLGFSPRIEIGGIDRDTLLDRLRERGSEVSS